MISEAMKRIIASFMSWPGLWTAEAAWAVSRVWVLASLMRSRHQPIVPSRVTMTPIIRIA
ncbi:hypothetical protein D3C86_2227190 [compost metagenome]